MKIYSNTNDYAIYTLRYYEDKYFISLFAHFKHKAKIYNHQAYTQIIIKNFLFFFFIEYKNEWKENKFWRQKNRKKWLLQKKKYIFNIDDIDDNKILVSKTEPYGKYHSLKHFTGNNDNDVVRPLCLKLSKMTGYINKFKENKSKKNKSKKNKFKENITMSLRVNDEQLF